MIKKILLIVALVLVAFASLRSCSKEPSIEFSTKSNNIGSQPFEINFSGVGDGLKRVDVHYVQGEKNLLLETKQYPGGVDEDTVTISLSPFAGIEDGPAEIRATVESYGGGLGAGGAQKTKTKKIVADLTPPRVIFISGTETILQTGSGVIVYKVSSDAEESGVKVGDTFFQGHKAAPGNGFTDEDVRIAFFSYPQNMEEGEIVIITAKDSIGNKRNLPVSYSLKKQRMTEIDVKITDKFIRMKMLPLVNASKDMSLKEVFLLVNNKIRMVNNKKIEKVLSRTADKILWEGAFVRPVGSLQSAFEKRNYTFNGEVIDTQLHLGYDLASRKQNPVRASNRGVVVFADDLGIYGNTIIVDHGMGIATLYAHMSSISAQRGDTVIKGEKIGSTGATGLAFGDHLHFGIYVGGVPVTPVEWWDPFWVETRITRNINNARKETSRDTGQ